MLSYYSGWNYLLELYFWLILAALLLVSITIYFGRPKPTNQNQDIDMELFEGTIDSLDAQNSDYNISHNGEEEKEEEIIEEKTPEILIAEEKRNWAVSFAVFGLIFIMFGSVLLFLSDSEFSVFLGSCMIYVGILSLIKGISFQISQEKYIINNSISLVVFFINFFLLFHLLGVIGNEPMMEKSEGRKFGDFILVYVLPYALWRIVPSTSIEGFEAQIDENIALETEYIDEFDEEEGRAIRDFAEENEDEYFSEEFNLDNQEEGDD